jgi:integrase
MAIYLHCPACKSRSPLSSRSCQKCKAPFPREGRRYRVEVSVDRNRATKVVDNLSIARELEAAMKANLLRDAHGLGAKKKAPSLGAVWNRYIEWARENKKTWQCDEWNYRRHIAHRFKDRTLDRLSAFDLEKLKSDLARTPTKRGESYAPATIKHQLVLIRRLYSVARKWGMYSGPDPFPNVEMPRLDNQVTEFLENAELERLLEVLDTWPFKEEAAFVKFVLLTGVRNSEACRLRWRDIDFERGLATLITPKGKKTVTIPISQAAVNLLRTLEPRAENVFPGRNDGQRSKFRKPWIRIRKAAGLPDDFRLHGLRHHFASALVSNGVDLAVVKELLTHKDISTTQRYAHLAPSAVRDAAEKSAKILTGTKKADVIELKK